MLAFLGLFKTCFCTYAAQTKPLTPSPCLTHNLYNCQMKLVGFLLGTRPAAHWLIMFSLCCGLWLLVSSDLVCLSLSLCLSVYLLPLLSVSISAPVLSLCPASVTRLVSFFMSSVRQMCIGVACSDITWKTIRICLPYIYSIYHIHWHFHVPTARHSTCH